MASLPVVKDVLRLYEEGKSSRDPRTKNWFLLEDNPAYVWVITALYLLFVYVGPKLMRNRKPFQLQTFMVVYNLGLVLMSTYMFIEIIISSYEIGYFKRPLCAVYNKDTWRNPKELRLANVLYWYFLSKVIEFMDTVLMVLRKKNSQVTFLHVFHHASILNIYWWVETYVPGGQSWFSASLNCAVHIVMYSYYGLSAIPSLREKLWWKKYITKFQLIQFVMTLSHTLQTGYLIECDYPAWAQTLLAWYMIILLVLFGNFYIKTYNSRKMAIAKKTDEKYSNGVVTDSVNGHMDKVSNGTANGYTKVKSH